MRLSPLFMGALSLLTILASAAEVVQIEDVDPGQEPLAAELPVFEETIEPGVFISAVFPDDNPFGHVTNGEKNKMILRVENRTPVNVTLVSVSGSFHNVETETLIRNITPITYGLPLFSGVKLQLPYSFHSELKPGDTRLRLWASQLVPDVGISQVQVYDSIVTIVEPEISVFDFKLISTYLMVASLVAGLGYVAFRTFVPQGRKRKVQSVSTPVGTVLATGAGGYQEEWIPEHHLKKSKTRKTTGVVAASSGDELTPADASGSELKKRKGRK